MSAFVDGCPRCKTLDTMPSVSDLQAIKTALLTLYDAGGPNYLSTMLDLPDSAIRWVLS